MATKITKLKKGELADFSNWKKINELIDAVNALMQMEISPTSTGQFQYADGNVKLVLNTTNKCPSA